VPPSPRERVGVLQLPAPSLRETIEDGAPGPPQMTPAAPSGGFAPPLCVL